MTSARVVLVALLVSLAARAAVADTYGVSAGTIYGRGMVPPTSDLAMLNYVRVHEHNGIIGKSILLILTVPTPPSGREISRSSSTVCGEYTCTTTTTISTAPPTAEDLAAYEAELAAYPETQRSILAGEWGLDLTFDLALDAMGGNGTGWAIEAVMPAFNSQNFSVVAGMGYASYTFSGLTRQHLNVVDDTHFSIDETSTPTRYKALMTPVRAYYVLNKHLVLHGQIDFNFLALDFPGVDFEAETSSFMRAGASLWLGPLFVRGEVLSNASDIEAITVGVSAGLDI